MNANNSFLPSNRSEHIYKVWVPSHHMMLLVHLLQSFVTKYQMWMDPDDNSLLPLYGPILVSIAKNSSANLV
ncbi:hypothetical protein SAMN06265219_11493 [Gracilimonas mengyeensis]|uniref:Uncharacterized protein n=1 Tax=Gracilimonas mengyeensis TaxID=1302730 RepID=A0A521F0M7_9BACT|nr:hypothetical protein SAMN06265219_11493 [Gracilimonas mengyeensis]